MFLKCGDAGSTAKIVMVRNSKGEACPWFQAKPIVVQMGYAQTHVSQTLEKIPEKHRKKLKELPGGVELSDRSTVGSEYHAGVSLYLSEAGLYELFIKSEKPTARPLQDWVFEEVLPAIRRTGSYSIAPEESAISRSQQVDSLVAVLQQQAAWQDHLEQRLVTRDQEQRAALMLVVQQMQADLAVALVEFEQQSQALVPAQSALASFVQSQQETNVALVESVGILEHRTEDMIEAVQRSGEQTNTAIANLRLFFCGAIASALSGFFRANGTGFFKGLFDFIQGNKQKRRTTHDPAMYPAEQRATDKDEVLKLEMLQVALELSPDLGPVAYAAVRNAFGKRAKHLRVFLYDAAPMHRALLWRNSPGGGQQYMYLTSERDILVRAWTGTHFGKSPPRAASCSDMAAARRAELLAAGAALGEWTSDSCSLLPNLFEGHPDE